MTANIRTWIEAILAWADSNNITIDRFTDAEAAVNLHSGKLYINMESQACHGPRLSTLGNGSLDDDHTVVSKPYGRRVRVRRGPVGKLKDVPYPPDTDDAQKLADASRSIAELLNGRLKHDFLDHFAGGAAS